MPRRAQLLTRRNSCTSRAGIRARRPGGRPCETASGCRCPDDAIVEVVVALLLVVAQARLECLVALVRFQHGAIPAPAGMRSAARRQAMPSSDSRISYSSHSSCWLSDTTRAPACGTRTSSLWPSRRCSASRTATADAMDAGQLGFGNLAARGHLALDDGGLDLLEDLVRQRFAIGAAFGSVRIWLMVSTIWLELASEMRNWRACLE